MRLDRCLALFGAVEVREHGLEKLCAGSRTESVERFSKSPLEFIGSHDPSSGRPSTSNRAMGTRVLVAGDHRREHRRDVSSHLVSHDLEGITLADGQDPPSAPDRGP
jgi:hypothetical protein